MKLLWILGFQNEGNKQKKLLKNWSFSTRIVPFLQIGMGGGGGGQWQAEDHSSAKTYHTHLKIQNQL